MKFIMYLIFCFFKVYRFFVKRNNFSMNKIILFSLFRKVCLFCEYLNLYRYMYYNKFRFVVKKIRCKLNRVEFKYLNLC